MSHTAVTPFSAADVIEEIEETKNAEPMAVTPNEQFTLLILLILLILLTLEDQYEYLVPGTHPRLSSWKSPGRASSSTTVCTRVLPGAYYSSSINNINTNNNINTKSASATSTATSRKITSRTACRGDLTPSTYGEPI